MKTIINITVCTHIAKQLLEIHDDVFNYDNWEIPKFENQ